MSLTDFFKRLGAPVANSRWSWGGVRADGSVVLRVWQDETIAPVNKRYARLTRHEAFAGNESNLGYQERLKHIALIQGGAKSYMVMCLAVDVNAAPRKIHSHNEKDVFVGGELIEHDNNYWLEMADRVPVSQVGQ